MMRFVLIFFLACCALQPVFGQAVPRVAFPVQTSGSRVTFGPMTATAANAANFSFGVAANGSIFADTGAALPTAGGNSIPIGVRSNIPKGPLLRAAATRFLSKTLPAVSTVLALKGLADDLKLIFKGDVGGVPNFSREKDNSIVDWVYYGHHAQTAVEACNAAAGDFPSHSTALYSPPVEYSPGNYVAHCRHTLDSTYIDNAFYGVATQSSKILEEVTASEVSTMIDDKTNWNPATSSLPKFIREILNSGEELPIQPSQITGPAMGTPKVAKSVDPQTGVETTTTTTPQYTYDGDSVTSQDYLVTKTKTADGVETTTQTGQKDTEPKLDPCEENPQSLACIELGSAGTPDQLKKTNHDVTIVAAVFAEASGCPPGITFSVFGKTYTMSYSPLCAFMAKIRTLIVALGAVAAAYIFANSFRV